MRLFFVLFTYYSCSGKVWNLGPGTRDPGLGTRVGVGRRLLGHVLVADLRGRQRAA